MAKEKIITGLDLGTNSIKVLSVLKKSNSAETEVLSKFAAPNFGMRRGVVVDPEKVSERISLALNRASVETGRKINDVYIDIGGSHIFLIFSRGSAAVSRADQSISQGDIERVIQSARTFPLSPNQEIIDFFPKNFIIDGGAGIKEPLGMKGVRLEADILALGAFSPYFKNLTSAVLNSGARIADVVCSPISSSRACLTPQQKELGVALLDIGAGKTDLTVYEEGDLVHLAVLPVGSSHITNDIAIGLMTDTEIAEEIKKNYGSFLKSRLVKISLMEEGEPILKDKKTGTSKEDGAALTCSSKLLRKIVEARVSQIFDWAQKEIKKSSSGILPAGVVITGGGANLANIVGMAKKGLKLPTRLGAPLSQQFLAAAGNSEKESCDDVSEEDPAFSAVWGLVLSAMENETDNLDFQKGIIDRMKKIVKIFIP